LDRDQVEGLLSKPTMGFWMSEAIQLGLLRFTFEFRRRCLASLKLNPSNEDQRVGGVGSIQHDLRGFQFLLGITRLGDAQPNCSKFEATIRCANQGLPSSLRLLWEVVAPTLSGPEQLNAPLLSEKAQIAQEK